MSNSSRPHGPQHARPPCPSPTSRVYSNSRLSSQWWHPTISSSVVPFSSHLQSFPASGSFQMSQLFASGGQRIGVSASASVLPTNIQDWLPLGWTGWISLQSKGLSPTLQLKSISSSALSFVYSPILTSIHDCWENHSLDYDHHSKVKIICLQEYFTKQYCKCHCISLSILKCMWRVDSLVNIFYQCLSKWITLWFFFLKSWNAMDELTAYYTEGKKS